MASEYLNPSTAPAGRPDDADQMRADTILLRVDYMAGLALAKHLLAGRRITVLGEAIAGHQPGHQHADRGGCLLQHRELPSSSC